MLRLMTLDAKDLAREQLAHHALNRRAGAAVMTERARAVSDAAEPLISRVDMVDMEV